MNRGLNFSRPAIPGIWFDVHSGWPEEYADDEFGRRWISRGSQSLKVF